MNLSEATLLDAYSFTLPDITVNHPTPIRRNSTGVTSQVLTLESDRHLALNKYNIWKGLYTDIVSGVHENANCVSVTEVLYFVLYK